jgi:hypothetical protein
LIYGHLAQDIEIAVRLKGKPVPVINVSFPNPLCAAYRMQVQVGMIRIDRTIQNLLKGLDSPIKSGNDRFIYLVAKLIVIHEAAIFTAAGERGIVYKWTITRFR